MMGGRLPWSALIGLARRNIARNKGRSALSLAAIGCGVAGLILSGGFVHDLLYQLGEAVIHSQSAHLEIAKAGYFDAGSRSPTKYLMLPAQVERIHAASVEHVKLAARRLGFSGLLSNGRTAYPTVGQGVEADKESTIGTSIVLLNGRRLSSHDTYGALVGAGVARAMNLQPGSQISLEALTVDGAMNTVDLQVVGTFRTYSKDYDDRAILVPLGVAQELMNTDGINVLALLLDDTRQTVHIAQELRTTVEPLGLEVRTWDELNDFYWKTVALYDRQFGVLQLVVLMMVMLAVTGAINMGALERTGEFGTMMALGSKRHDVVRLVVLEAALLGLVGALIGLAFGAALGWVISRIGIPMPPPPNSNLGYLARIRLVPAVLGTASVVGVAATLFASLPAAFRVSRRPIVDALRTLA